MSLKHIYMHILVCMYIFWALHNIIILNAREKVSISFKRYQATLKFSISYPEKKIAIWTQDFQRVDLWLCELLKIMLTLSWRTKRVRLRCQFEDHGLE